MLWKIVKRVVSPKNNQNGTWRLISDPLPPPLQMNTANGSGFPFQMLRQCICNNFILGNLSSQSLTTILNLKFFEFFGGHLTPNPYFSPPSTGISQTPQPVFFCRLASSGAGTTAAIVAAWNWNGAAGVILEISKSSPLGGLKKSLVLGSWCFQNPRWWDLVALFSLLLCFFSTSNNNKASGLKKTLVKIQLFGDHLWSKTEKWPKNPTAPENRWIVFRCHGLLSPDVPLFCGWTVRILKAQKIMSWFFVPL